MFLLRKVRSVSWGRSPPVHSHRIHLNVNLFLVSSNLPSLNEVADCSMITLTRRRFQS